jgi:hypothetical protein
LNIERLEWAESALRRNKMGFLSSKENLMESYSGNQRPLGRSEGAIEAERDMGDPHPAAACRQAA